MAFNTPSGGSAENGFPSNTEAVNHASQLNQFLNTANSQVIYPGTSILVSTPHGPGQIMTLSSAPPNIQDRSQPFVMPVGKTSIGRVVLPVQPQGAGSDVQFILCPDDGSGNPNLAAPITSTVIPATWMTNLTINGSLTTDVPPLVTTQYNAISLQNNFAFNWSQPAIGPGGAAQYATITTSGLYSILSGGYSGTAASGTVVTIQSLGGGFISNPTLQPSLPQPVWYHMMCATTSAVFVAGGTDGGNFYKTTWSASWDPNTGTVGAWTAQASLPNNVMQGSMVSWGDFVYVIGGNADLTPANSYNNVYFANAANGQVQSWTSVTPLPAGLQLTFAAAINGWLVVAGGQSSTGTAQSRTLYARIDSVTGKLGSWFTGPSMPTACYAFASQWNMAWTDEAMCIFSGVMNGGVNYTPLMQSLAVMQNSVANAWWAQDTGDTGVFQVAAYPHGEPGNWQINVLENTKYLAADTTVVPYLSVPLPATGLTPGNTYHIVVHPRNEDLTNYTQLYVAPSTTFSPYKLRARYSNDAWVTQGSGFSFPITIYDNTPGASLPIHLWQDPSGTTTNIPNQGMAASTFVYDWYGKLLGYCDSFSTPQASLNLNPLVNGTTTSWTVSNGTLTSTAAQVHNGYTSSGLLTPNGSSATVSASTEMIPVLAGNPYTATAWLYATTAISSPNVSMSVNWYDSSQTLISTSSNGLGITAATWTYFNSQYVAPATAAYATMVPTLTGTPSAGNPLYLSYAALLFTDPDTLSSVAEITYSGTTPQGPSGVIQLN